MGKSKKEKKKSKKPLILLVSAIFILTAALVLVNVIYKQQITGRFYDNTILNGQDVSGKSVREVLEMLTTPYKSASLEIMEGDQSQLKLGYGTFGYTVDEEKLNQDINKLVNRQNGIIPFCLLAGSEYGVRIPFSYDETAFRAAISQSKFATPRVETKDAEMIKGETFYEIDPEVYGNTFDDAQFAEIAKEAVASAFSANPPQFQVQVSVPENLYKVPSVTRGDIELNRVMNIYNKYVNAKIVHVFGDEKLTLDWDTIQDWIIMDGDGSIDDEKAYNYAENLAMEYDTMYYERTITTHDGRSITLPSNDYGYMIDVDAEFSQLIDDINANTSVEREPVYAERGFSRNGVDDLNGNYVEVDITQQHLWLYRNGEVVIDSDVVTGLPKDDRETIQGAFPIPYKQSPANLKGQGGGAGESWDVKVSYWMPFYDGQGLHDASWRTAFGGNIYLTNGSHGCVNLPTYVAETIFENIDENFPIILYK